mgnify:CR=1 FL=1
MLKAIKVALVLALAPWQLAAEPTELSVHVTDALSGKAADGTRIIVNHGPQPQPVAAEMIQKNRQFQPHVLVVPKDSKVDFPNRDATQHHVYSFSPAKVFDIELYADQPDEPIIFDTVGVVEVGCNIHDHMQGFILVTNSGLTASTDESGLAHISLPGNISGADKISLSLWHPRLDDNTQTVDFIIDPNPESVVELKLALEPKPAGIGRLNRLQQRFQDL